MYVVKPTDFYVDQAKQTRRTFPLWVVPAVGLTLFGAGCFAAGWFLCSAIVGVQ